MTDRPTDLPTDRPRCRVACPRLKRLISDGNDGVIAPPGIVLPMLSALIVRAFEFLNVCNEKWSTNCDCVEKSPQNHHGSIWKSKAKICFASLLHGYFSAWTWFWRLKLLEMMHRSSNKPNQLVKCCSEEKYSPIQGLL